MIVVYNASLIMDVHPFSSGLHIACMIMGLLAHRHIKHIDTSSTCTVAHMHSCTHAIVNVLLVISHSVMQDTS